MARIAGVDLPNNKKLSLAHLKLRILLADHIKTTFTLYDLAVLAALLDGCFNFHFRKFLFVSERNSSFC